jgi:hypothetical protein
VTKSSRWSLVDFPVNRVPNYSGRNSCISRKKKKGFFVEMI